jgi:hypothetical protein
MILPVLVVSRLIVAGIEHGAIANPKAYSITLLVGKRPLDLCGIRQHARLALCVGALFLVNFGFYLYPQSPPGTTSGVMIDVWKPGQFTNPPTIKIKAGR